MSSRGRIMSEEERITIINWIKNDIFDRFIPDICNRKHFILLYTDTTIIKPIWDILERIIEKENLQGCKREPTLKHFIAYIPKGAWIQEHTDRNINELIHCRFNIFLQCPPSNYITYYDGKKIEEKEGEYVFCRSGLDPHYSTVNENDLERISISLGFLLPWEKVQEVYNKNKV